MNIIKKLRFLLLLVCLFFLLSSNVSAAAPDGAGPWADTVVSTTQGLMKNGSAVPVIRSNPNSALGVAENNTVEGNFYSLGFGGNLVLGLDNGISSGIIVVEATNPNYPNEKATVEVSENGSTWVIAGTVSQDGYVTKPSSVSCARFVRLTDVSDSNSFSDETADGYDVDGVKATGNACYPPIGSCEDATLFIENTNIVDHASKKFTVNVEEEMTFHIHVNSSKVLGNQITFASPNQWLELIPGSISDGGTPSSTTTNFKIIWPKVNDGDVTFKAKVKSSNLITGVWNRGYLMTIGAHVASARCGPKLELYGVSNSSGS